MDKIKIQDRKFWDFLDFIDHFIIQKIDNIREIKKKFPMDL